MYKPTNALNGQLFFIVFFEDEKEETAFSHSLRKVAKESGCVIGAIVLAARTAASAYIDIHFPPA